MSKNFRFTRMELAGSLGDLGTILPLAVGMIMINNMNPIGIFIGVGLYYILSGFYFKVTCPVEPMKVISAYAIATGITATQMQASCLWIFAILFIIGSVGLIDTIGRLIPKPVIRGVQLSTGLLLLSQGIKLIAGTSTFQIMRKTAEPYLVVQHIGFLPIGLLLGALLGIMTLLLLENKRFPAAVMIVGVGLIIGFFWGNQMEWTQLKMGLNLPSFLPNGLPTADDFSFALLILVLPQIPMTIGNAVIANADLSNEYFKEESHRVTYKGLCLSMALANLGSFFIGGMPMCHGALGLASRYRFGARTAGSNLIIGSIFLIIAVVFGSQILLFINLLPMSTLGVLLVFAGAQLALSILDMTTRKELFVVVFIVGVTLASNLAAGFLVGIVIAAILRSEKISV